ncbi:hypothetical protein BDR03DRAFT_981148 [Suillus americanus]|nr:hypothetical protein BDR03DRAFT_981148 [Suillus americanus]
MTYIYNHIPGIITGFEHTGSFSDLRNIGPCYVPIDEFWPLQKDPLGYIGMNGHSSPLIKPSGRTEYKVLVPIYGLTPQDKDELNCNVALISRVYDHRLIAVWMKFITKLVPWPYGHRNEAIFDGLDDIIDDMVTEDFENTSSFGHVYTDDYTTASFQQEYGRVYGFIPNTGTLPVNHPWLLIARSLKMTLFGSLITGRYGNAMRVVKLWPYRHQFITQCFLEALLRIGFSYQDCQNIDFLELTLAFDHTPNSSLSDLRKVIGHCLKPCKDFGFCLTDSERQTRLLRMTAVLDQAAAQLNKGQNQTLVAFDHHIVTEILGLQMTKELWHYMILRLIASNPNVCVADLYWDRVLDQGGNPNMGIISLIFYEYCQKALDRNLNRTGDAAVIKLYHRIARLHGPPLMEIQEVGRDLGYIRQRWKAQENEYRSPQQNL